MIEIQGFTHVFKNYMHMAVTGGVAYRHIIDYVGWISEAYSTIELDQ